MLATIKNAKEVLVATFACAAATALGQVAPSITFACAVATAPGAGGSFYYFCVCGGDRSCGTCLLLILLLVRRPVLGQVAPSIVLLLVRRRPVLGQVAPSSTFACAGATAT